MERASDSLRALVYRLRRSLVEEACRMYHGEFLPTMIGDSWVASENWLRFF